MPDYGPLGRRLTELLAAEPYRRTWFPYSSGRSRRAVPPTAVAAMLRRCLSAEAEELGLDSVSDYALKARIRRLLDGRNASPLLVEAIGACAGFSETEREEVRRLCHHAGAAIGLRQLLRPDLPDLLNAERATDEHHRRPTRGWRTDQLSERHSIGEDRLPRSHVTRQSLTALRDLDRYPYQFDTNMATVHVSEGGSAGQVYAVGNGLYAVDIVFGQRLAAGDQWHLEYETSFQYSTPPPPEFRRASLTTPIPSVEISVDFAPGHKPHSCWWSTWDSPGADEPSTSEPVTPVGVRLFRRTALAAGQTAGFRWEF